jgi:alpha-L-rhamnosidase
MRGRIFMRTSWLLVPLLLFVAYAAPMADSRESRAAVRSGGGANGALVVHQLRTEYVRDPLGIDVRRPRLSWTLTSPRRGQAQTAYRILVASDPARLAKEKGDVWDSGKVASDRSVAVPYDGPPLSSKTRYYWKVMAWGVHGARSHWSPPARWETALLDSEEWHAQWIGSPPSELTTLKLDGSSWIWFPEGNPGESAPAGTRYLRRTFTVPADKTVASAHALLTADNQFDAYLNGAKVAASDRTVSAWQHAVAVDVTDEVRSGANSLAIAAINADGAAGFIGVLELTFEDGSSVTLHSDDQWKAFDADVTGWTEPDFDDSAWPAALEIAPYGEGIWTCCGGVQLAESTRDPLLRKTFRVTKPVQRARLYMSGLGHHELRLNGSKVGDQVLETDVNDYGKRVGYSTYDITSYLKRDANAVSVMLGRGFYDVSQPTPLDWHRAPWRDDPKLVLQMEIRYEDGTTRTVVSDESWKTAEGPITSDSYFGGEDYDARLEQAGWDTGPFDDSSWQPARAVAAPAGRLVATNNDPVKVIDTLRSVSTTEAKPGVYVLDMGQTITGWGRLTASAPAGTKVTMQYGQKLLSDGTVDYHNGWHGGRSQTDSYTFSGEGTETWEPRFSYKSFRYLQITGLPGAPDAKTVVGRSVHSAVGNAGGFDSSSELFATLHDGMRRTILGNLMGFPAVDPFYEKSGWTEDVFVAAQSMIYNFDMARFFGEWLEDIRDSQLPSGQIPIIIPSPGWGYDSWGTPSPVWTAVYPIMAWRMYENYGDRRVLEEHYPSIKKYMDREISLLQDGIVAAEFLGDYMSPGFYGQPPEDGRLAGTAYIYRQLKIAAAIADALGRGDDAAGYRADADRVRDRFNATFLDEEDGRYETATDPGYRQTSNLLALAFGMVPAEHKRRVLDNVVADIRAKGNHLDTGTLGTEVILSVLTENGAEDVAYAIANQRTYPSWGYWYANGADTMWENWDLNVRSRAHFFLGTSEQWLYRHVAGIDADAPGYKRITIRPHPGGGLHDASASYDSIHGEIKSAWEAGDDGFELKATVPVNTVATVYVPADAAASVTESGRPAAKAPGVRFLRMDDGNAVFEVGAGKYRFVSG